MLKYLDLFLNISFWTTGSNQCDTVLIIAVLLGFIICQGILFSEFLFCTPPYSFVWNFE